jgi:hypothetical protein
MPGWPPLPYEAWSDTCDTLHAHAQVLGKLSAALLPPEPHYEHLALRLTALGWETRPLPAPDGSGAFGVALDLHRHEAVVEHSAGASERIALAPDRSVGEVTRAVLAAVRSLAGAVEIPLTPSETGWTTPLDEDEEHATYDPARVADYFAAATRASLVLGALRAAYRGPSTPVNAWWGSFDLAVSLFAGAPIDPAEPPPAHEVAVGWWPGDARHPRAAFYAYARPSPSGYERAAIDPPAARWDTPLGEFLLDWDDVRTAGDPHAAALAFGRSAVAQAAELGGWDPALAASAQGS